MNYDNNLNPNDTISSLDKGMASGGGVGKQENPRQLRRRFTAAMVALLLTFLAVSSATYAWYIYNTSRHTTNVRMAAGAGVNLQISNSYSGTYGSAAVLDSFAGQLVPVSTNRISGGFQKVLGFTEEQAEAILELMLYRLTGLEITVFQKEYAELEKYSKMQQMHRMAAAIRCIFRVFPKRRFIPAAMSFHNPFRRLLHPFLPAEF